VGIQEYLGRKLGGQVGSSLSELQVWRERELRKLEKTPIYYGQLKQVVDEHLWDRLVLHEMFKAHRVKIDRVFAALLKKTGEAILAERDSQQLEQLIVFYQETEKMNGDYQSRNSNWEKMAFSLHGEEIEFNLAPEELTALGELEVKYAKYNGERGLRAFHQCKAGLARAREKVHAAEAEALQRAENAMRLQEILQEAKQFPPRLAVLGERPQPRGDAGKATEVNKEPGKEAR